MPAGKHKSRTFRRIMRRVIGGTKLHYVKRKPQAAHCASCGRVLAGVPRGRDVMIRKLAKTERRPERPYGGVLCSACMRTLLKARARS
ncbi:50S ribosomal protein L34e [Candidatus Woesearchaeota archaeon]|nr:50S ribosomal protein L34e [Candidatus Woesearchaeota archaeon]